MLVQHALYLGGINVFTAGNDHVVLAIVYREIPVRIAGAYVSGEIPSVAQYLVRRLLVLPVPDKNVGAAQGDFAGGAVCNLAAVLIDNARFAAQAGYSGRAARP